MKLPLSHLFPGNVTEEEMKRDEEEVKRVQDKIRGIQRILQEHSAIFWQKIVLQCCELSVSCLFLTIRVLRRMPEDSWPYGKAKMILCMCRTLDFFPHFFFLPLRNLRVIFKWQWNEIICFFVLFYWLKQGKYQRVTYLQLNIQFENTRLQCHTSGDLKSRLTSQIYFFPKS